MPATSASIPSRLSAVMRSAGPYTAAPSRSTGRGVALDAGSAASLMQTKGPASACPRMLLAQKLTPRKHGVSWPLRTVRCTTCSVPVSESGYWHSPRICAPVHQGHA